jgi:hypothetical protein
VDPLRRASAGQRRLLSRVKDPTACGPDLPEVAANVQQALLELAAGAPAVGVRLERTVAVAGYGSTDARFADTCRPRSRSRRRGRRAWRSVPCRARADLSRLLRMWADDDSGFSAAGVSVHGGKPFALMR